MKKSEKIHVRMSFEEEIIKNLLPADSDLARRLDSIRRSEKVKEAYASAKQEVKKKAAEAVAKGVKVSLKKIFKIVAIQHPRRIVDKIVLYSVNDLHSDLLRLIHRERERLNVAVIGDRHCLVTPIVRAAD